WVFGAYGSEDENIYETESNENPGFVGRFISNRNGLRGKRSTQRGQNRHGGSPGCSRDPGNDLQYRLPWRNTRRAGAGDSESERDPTERDHSGTPGKDFAAAIQASKREHGPGF